MHMSTDMPMCYWNRMSVCLFVCLFVYLSICYAISKIAHLLKNYKTT